MRTCRGMAAGALSLLSLAACSAPSPYQVGEPCEVVFQDYRSGVRLGLRNESQTSRQDLYGRVQSSTSTKVISDGLMEYLIQEFADAGFFPPARDLSLPEKAPSGASGGLSVRLNDRRYSRTWGRQDDPGELEEYLELSGLFRRIYDGTFQAQRIGERGAKYFRDTQKRLEGRKP